MSPKKAGKSIAYSPPQGLDKELSGSKVCNMGTTTDSPDDQTATNFYWIA